ncbi:undecaprenyl-diphosphate phosphatase [bacterium]|jgi:undecaprenyl-diphosphatase|nr:undecaprenyl-diphosphate phosphatase [bacterium]
MRIDQMIGLALVQGAAELLPVSSSAHVIVAEKLMGLDPSTPEMTFLLVMLHTGTMFAVLTYFWSRWRRLSLDFFKMTLVATFVTGVIGFGLKIFLEKILLPPILKTDVAEIEHLFKSLPLIAVALFLVGLLILRAGKNESQKLESRLGLRQSLWIGLVQGLCLPFRGFSRSGATISAGLLCGVQRSLAEDFSFALAVILTPPVVVHSLHRLMKASGLGLSQVGAQWGELLMPGLLGMCFSFIAGLLALRWLSSWLEHGKWKYFGYYCIVASLVIFSLSLAGF